MAEARDTYDATVANYRQTVLTAFQQVEDNLAALRVLENEAGTEDAAVRAAQDALNISTYQVLPQFCCRLPIEWPGVPERYESGVRAAGAALSGERYARLLDASPPCLYG